MMSLLATFEQNAFSVWMRESPSLFAFPFILYLHTLGLALLAGLHVGLDLWLLSARTLPAFRLSNVYRLMWLGFAINLLSGLALLAAYPAKALTNWVFYAKMGLVVLVLWMVERMRGELTVADGAAREASPRALRLAAASLLVWGLTILAGRYLAYTAELLLVSEGL